MKFKIFIAIIFTCFLFNNWALGMEVPEGKITVKVVDELNIPMEGMLVNVSFQIPHPEKRGIAFNKVKGFTDSLGIFSAKSNSLYKLSFGVEKTGYYKSIGEFQFNKIKTGKMQLWNPTVELVMRKVEKPVPMYAKRLIIEMPVTDKAVGFDLMEADWVAPYGKGKKIDFLFKLNGMVKSWNEFEGILTLTFSNKFDGILLVKEDRENGSELKLPRYAPEEDYEMKLEKHNKSFSDAPYDEDYEKDNNYIFRIRSEEEDGNLVKAMYGKIHGDISFDPREGKAGAIAFKYYLNPDYTRNLEFDPKQNLFKGLKNRERVGLN